MNISREELSEDKKIEYDALISRMMQEIEEELEKLPPQPKNQLDGDRSKVYRDISNKYLPEIRRILNSALNN